MCQLFKLEGSAVGILGRVTVKVYDEVRMRSSLVADEI